MTRIVVFVLAALLALSSCIAIPNDGPVQAAESDNDLGQSSTRFEPAGPPVGASQSEIIHGFLESMLAYPESLAIAKQFLTPEGIKKWDPQAGTLVYSRARVTILASGDDAQINLDIVAELDSQGRYTKREEHENLEVPLVRHQDEWRINQAPAGLLISEDYFSDHMRPFDLAFIDESGTRIIYEPVHAIVGEKLATTLMHALSAGPAGSAAGWQHSYVPSIEYVQSSVPLLDGRAQVDIDFHLGNRSDIDNDRMAAQIIETLTQVPAVESVQITSSDGLIADTTETSSGMPGWAQFSLDDSRRHAHIVADNRVWRADSLQPRQAPSYLAKDAKNARAVALDQERVAAVWRDRAQVSALDGSDVVKLDGSAFLDPVVDVFDAAWLVDARGSSSRVRVVQDDYRHTLDIPSDLDIASFAVSPDGARLAISSTSGQVFVGKVIRVGRLVTNLEELKSLDLESSNVQSVQWLTATTLIFTTKDAPRQLREVRIDGTRAVTSWSTLGRWLPDVKVSRLLISPSEEPLVTIMDSQKRVWLWEAPTWELVDIDKVSGLS